jgi:hypothetical protein
MARSLREQPNGVVLFPALEEIQLSEMVFIDDEDYRTSQLAVFQPFVSTRQQAGRPVKVAYDSSSYL